MPGDPELRLISKIAATPGSLERVLSRGVRVEHFTDDQCAEVWVSIMTHLRRYKSAPSLDRVRQLNPDWRPELCSDTVDFIVDEFVREVKRRFTVTAMGELADLVDAADEDVMDKIDELFQEKARELAMMVPSTTSARLSHAPNRVQAYLERRFNMQRGSSILMGIPIIDDLTMGIQPKDFVSVVGWSSIGKSTLAQFIAYQAWLQGFTSLVISLEMEHEAMMRKWDVMATNIEYRALKAMELRQPDYRKWEAWAKRAQEAPNDIVVIDSIANCNVETVYAETMRHAPDLVIVDYISLMDWAQGKRVSMWEGITQLTKGLKANARMLSTPVIGIAQTNIAGAEEGAKANNIAYSRSIYQDSDLVIGLHQDEKMKDYNRMKVRLLKNRDGKQADCDMFWNPDYMRFEEWKASHLFNRKHEETADPQGEPSGDPTDPREIGA